MNFRQLASPHAAGRKTAALSVDGTHQIEAGLHQSGIASARGRCIGPGDRAPSHRPGGRILL